MTDTLAAPNPSVSGGRIRAVYDGTMTDEYVDYTADSSSSADRVVARFHTIDERVNAMREQRLNDPDSLGDKLIKYLLPTVAGLMAGKLFQMLWNRGASRKGADVDAQQSLLTSLLFAAGSAAFGAVLTQLADRGSKALVNRRHRKRG